MSQAYIEICKYIEQAGLEELRQLIPMLETRQEQLENKKWREVFRENKGFPVATTNFKSNYDAVTSELDGLSVEFGLGETDAENNVEFEITPMSVAVTIFTDEADYIANTWEVFGSPDNFNISDSTYNEDPESQLRIPLQVLEYMLYLWKGFLYIINPEDHKPNIKEDVNDVDTMNDLLDALDKAKDELE